MVYIIAFLVGGTICAIAQIILNKCNIQPGKLMVGLVCTGVVLGAIGIYKPFSEWAGAGATVPLLGFGNVLYKGVHEEIASKGFIGIFSGGLKASAVGISAAIVLGYIMALLFKPKMKK